MIINTIVMSIFGISMLDIYGINIITNLFYEITQIIGNVIKYLSNTQFYIFLNNLFTNKIESNPSSGTKDEFQPMTKEISGATKRNEESIKESRRIAEWLEKVNHKEEEWLDKINKEEEKEEIHNSNLNYFIIGGIIITLSACLIYIHWDDITPYTTSIWNWIRRRGRGDGGNNPDIPNNNDNRYNRWVDYLGLNRNNNNNNNNNPNRNNTIVIPDEDNTSIVLEDLTDHFPLEEVANKGKEVMKNKESTNLTSSSLENLNSTVEESWSNSRPTSPQS